jgi:hypothetical protein
MGVLALRLGNDRYLSLLDLDRPVQVIRLFTTLADGQRKAIFHFYFRRRPGGDWRPIGRVEWDELPPSRAGEPTLELRLVPGRSGSLLLRLRERTLGTARSYRLQLPEVPPQAPLDVPPGFTPEAPRAAPRRRRQPGARPRTHSPADGPAAARKRFRRRGVTIGLTLAAVLLLLLLAIGTALLFRLVPWRQTHAQQKPAQARSMPVVPRQPAPPVAPAPPGGAKTEQAAPAVKPAASARGARPEAAADLLSYRVRWGDTLWRITEQYYGNPHLYSLLAGENAIVDPDLILPGTELRLPPRIDDRERKR